MIAIIDYAAGNVRSVENALERLGAEYITTSDTQLIATASHVILPGVGEAATAMQSLRESALDTTIRRLTQPVLGICIGMQLMCRHSDEGATECLGIFDTDVCRLTPMRDEGVKVPQMGWNTIDNMQSALFEGITPQTFVYYVHSYAAGICPDTIATTTHGVTFSAALRHNNFYGTQFHPEKSGAAGSEIVKNFLKL